MFLWRKLYDIFYLPFLKVMNLMDPETECLDPDFYILTITESTNLHYFLVVLFSIGKGLDVPWNRPEFKRGARGNKVFVTG